MSEKHGNVIDYRGDPGMQNSDEGEAPKMGSFKDLTGQRFGRLTAVNPVKRIYLRRI